MNMYRNLAACTAAVLLAASVPAGAQGLGGAVSGALNGGLGGSMGQGGAMGGGAAHGGLGGGLHGDTGGIRDGIGQGVGRTRAAAGESKARTRSAADSAAARARDSSAAMALRTDATANGAGQAVQHDQPPSQPPSGLGLGLAGDGETEMAGRRTGASGDARARAEASDTPLSLDGNFAARSVKAEPATSAAPVEAQPAAVSAGEKPAKEPKAQ